MRISDWSSDVCSSDLARVPLPLLRGIIDGDYREPPRSTGQLRLELVVLPLLQHRPRQWRVDADPAQPGIGLVRTDDAITAGLAAECVLDLDRRAEEHRAGVRRRRLAHAQRRQALEIGRAHVCTPATNAQ